MQVHIEFDGLLAPNTAAHGHCCLPSPFLTGVNAGVATTTPTFTGFPTGATSGVYDHIFDLTDIDTYNHSSPTAFFATHGGTVASAEAALIAGIKDGESYLNVHSSRFPGGEIRGFLVAVPEPGIVGLFALGLLGGWTSRRRRPR
jgi:hypothetical protein